MNIQIFQLSEKSVKKDTLNGQETLLYKPYNKYLFNLKNYQIININFQFNDIPFEQHETILNRIARDFESFNAFEQRPTVKIIPSDLVKIGEKLYYYNGDNHWINIA